jgi:hypothetical protein
MKAIFVLLVLALVLLPTTTALKVVVSSDAGSTSETFVSGIGDSVNINTFLSPDGLSNSISGSGSFKEDHWLKDDHGEIARVGVNVKSAKKYDYSYKLSRFDYPDSNELEASENLNVANATEIKAYAEARNSKEDRTLSEILILDGSLEGYSNVAMVSEDWLYSYQGFSKAEGKLVRVMSKVRSGEIRPNVDSLVSSGTLTNSYTGACAHKDYASAWHGSHIELKPEGVFESTASSDSEETTRTSNYGTEYDLNMYASYYDGNPWVHGHLAYYVDIANPLADSIQKAVDAASDCHKDSEWYWSTDSILVAPGVYKENLNLDKSLDITGSGTDKTIIDGQRLGSVIGIDKDTCIRLYGLTIQNGSSILGGGINNFGALSIDNCIIKDNEAYGVWINQPDPIGGYGGGIYNEGYLNLQGGDITSNNAFYGGGIYNEGVFNMNGGNITSNLARLADGGDQIHNEGTFNRNGGYISQNSHQIENLRRFVQDPH